MNHVGKQTRNRVVGVLGGLLVGAALGAGQEQMQQLGNIAGQMTGQVYSQEFETEADYVGMYYLAQAGYRLDTVETFWRRMAAEDPKQIRMGFSHPSTASRFVGIQATRQEITAKAATGVELKPTLKAP
jgi:predicted Zn-dependent protease